MKKASITSLGLSPEEERRRRVIKYSVAMSIRMACVVLMLFTRGWWLLIVAIGAIVLPYIAVVIANTPVRTRAQIDHPGGVIDLPPASSGPQGHTSPPAPGGPDREAS